LKNGYTSSLDLPNNVKIYIRTYVYNEYIVRFHNSDDVEKRVLTLYDLKTKSCTLLNNFANVDTLKVDSITELSLLTTKDKEDVHPNPLDKNLHANQPNDGGNKKVIFLII
jgi:hypothetical protein